MVTGIPAEHSDLLYRIIPVAAFQLEHHPLFIISQCYHIFPPIRPDHLKISYSYLFFFPGILIIRKELLQNVDTVLGRIPPQDRTECVNRLPPPAVIGTETDIPNTGAQFLYDLLHIS